MTALNNLYNDSQRIDTDNFYVLGIPSWNKIDKKEHLNYKLNNSPTFTGCVKYPTYLYGFPSGGKICIPQCLFVENAMYFESQCGIIWNA